MQPILQSHLLNSTYVKGWLRDSVSGIVYPVIKAADATNATAGIELGLDQTGNDYHRDLSMFLRSTDNRVRVCFDLDSGLFRLNSAPVNGGVASVPNLDYSEGDLVTQAVNKFGLTKTKVSFHSGFVEPSASDTSVATKAGLTTIAISTYTGTGSVENTYVIYGYSRLGYSGYWLCRGYYDNYQWRRTRANANVTVNILESGVATRTGLYTAIGAITPDHPVIPYATEATSWDTARVPVQSPFNVVGTWYTVLGAAVVDPTLSFELVPKTEPVNPAKFDRFRHSTYDFSTVTMANALRSNLNDRRVIANVTASKRDESAVQLAELEKIDGLLRISTLKPFTVPSISTWHADIAELDLNENFMKDPNWSRKTFDAKFAGKQESLFLSWLSSENDNVHIGVVAGSTLAITLNGMSVNLSAVPQNATLLVKDALQADSAESLLSISGRSDVEVVTEHMSLTAELGKIPLFKYEASKASAERFLALKGDVRTRELESAALVTVDAYLAAYNLWMGSSSLPSTYGSAS